MNDMRKFNLDSQEVSKLDILKAALCAEYNCKNLLVNNDIKYMDADGDYITISGDDDLADALCAWRESKSKAFKLWIERSLSRPPKLDSPLDITLDTPLSSVGPVLTQAAMDFSMLFLGFLQEIGHHGKNVVQYLIKAMNEESDVAYGESHLGNMDDGQGPAEEPDFSLIDNNSDLSSDSFTVLDGNDDFADNQDHGQLSDLDKVNNQEDKHATGALNVTFKDVNIPDGTKIACGASFVKIWNLENSGTCPWPAGCQLEHLEGRILGIQSTFILKEGVPSGNAIEIKVHMTAPQQIGKHVSFWRMIDPSGNAFGRRIWVSIICTEPKDDIQPANVEADFVGAKEDPQKYKKEKDIIRAMGYLNDHLVDEVLENSGGDLQQAVDKLISLEERHTAQSI